MGIAAPPRTVRRHPTVEHKGIRLTPLNICAVRYNWSRGLDRFHPAVATWFGERFGVADRGADRGWAEIAAGRDTLIMAPTGSGKTLAAFSPCIDELVRARSTARSPIARASSTSRRSRRSAQRRRAQPRGAARAASQAPATRARVAAAADPHRAAHRRHAAGRARSACCAGRRTCSSPRPSRSTSCSTVEAGARAARAASDGHRRRDPRARRQQARRAPRAVARAARRARARDGGSGRSASASRRRCEPLDEVARFLDRRRRDGARPCRIVDAGREQPLDLAVEVPERRRSARSRRARAWGEIYERLAAADRDAPHDAGLRADTRRMGERVAHELERAARRRASSRAHHGSLSRKRRALASSSGSRRASCARWWRRRRSSSASTSATVDLVVPARLAALDRGRCCSASAASGHCVGGTPKGRIFAMTRDELVECAALVRAMRARRASIGRRSATRRSTCWRSRSSRRARRGRVGRGRALRARARRRVRTRARARASSTTSSSMLADGIATRAAAAARSCTAIASTSALRGRRGARLAALTSGGAIPDNADYASSRSPTGTSSARSTKTSRSRAWPATSSCSARTSWRIRRVERGGVRVEDAHGAPPTMPFWHGEGLARTVELSREVADAARRARRAPTTRRGASSWLDDELRARPRAAPSRRCDVRRRKARSARRVPTQTRVVAERFFDEARRHAAGHPRAVRRAHQPRVGPGAAQALLPLVRLRAAGGRHRRRRSCCRSGRSTLPARDDLRASCAPASVEEMLAQAALQAPMLETRWRWNATRSLAVLALHAAASEVPPPLQRMRAARSDGGRLPRRRRRCQDNHGGVRDHELPDHPLVRETMRDCLHEAMDADGLERVLERVDAGEITCAGARHVGAVAVSRTRS